LLAQIVHDLPLICTGKSIFYPGDAPRPTGLAVQQHAHAARQFVAVEHRQADVEDREVGAEFAHRVQRGDRFVEHPHLVAVGAQQARQRLGAIDVVIDIGLPVLDGYELARRMRVLLDGQPGGARRVGVAPGRAGGPPPPPRDPAAMQFDDALDQRGYSKLKLS
jgi:CheY-like chemotaxis protein